MFQNVMSCDQIPTDAQLSQLSISVVCGQQRPQGTCEQSSPYDTITCTQPTASPPPAPPVTPSSGTLEWPCASSGIRDPSRGAGGALDRALDRLGMLATAVSQCEVSARSSGDYDFWLRSGSSSFSCTPSLLTATSSSADRPLTVAESERATTQQQQPLVSLNSARLLSQCHWQQQGGPPRLHGPRRRRHCTGAELLQRRFRQARAGRPRGPWYETTAETADLVAQLGKIRLNTTAAPPSVDGVDHLALCMRSVDFAERREVEGGNDTSSGRGLVSSSCWASGDASDDGDTLYVTWAGGGGSSGASGSGGGKIRRRYTATALLDPPLSTGLFQPYPCVAISCRQRTFSWHHRPLSPHSPHRHTSSTTPHCHRQLLPVAQLPVASGSQQLSRARSLEALPSSASECVQHDWCSRSQSPDTCRR